MEVGGRESGWVVFLWLVPVIEVSITASYVLRKCRIDVLVSVFWDARESMELLYDGECLHDSAVSSYFLEIPHFTLPEGPKVFKNNVWNIYSVPPKVYIIFVYEISYARFYTMFLQ